jgi:phage baseplate assembly protein W
MVRNMAVKFFYKGIGLPSISNPYPSIKTDKELVSDSILTLLLTKTRQRLFVPEFGSRLYELLFNQNDVVAARLAEEIVSEAINAWEPRVKLLNVKVRADEGTLKIYMTLLLLKLNITFQLPLEIVRDKYLELV